jgi:NAD(P)-dependent dehydrogenase (short-subunit alcohol dehydrogenase family)
VYLPWAAWEDARMTLELRGAAIVTGGASGLGAATARRLAAEGMAVLVADVNDEAGAVVEAELGAGSRFLHTDVTDADAVAAAAAAAAGLAPEGLRLAVACAGIGIAERLLGKRGPHAPDTFRRTIEINLVGTFHLLRAAAETMAANEQREDERGVVVTTASVAAYDGQIGQIAYSASKGGVVGMTLPAARDLAQHGIRVCTIAPGVFDTPLVGLLPEPARESLAASIPFPSRFGRPEEYAELVVAIARNPVLNGETIRLDGALRMGPR